MMYTGNGNGGIPATKPGVSSRGLRHKNLTKMQRAAYLARVLAGEAAYTPTAKELATFHDVPMAYVSAIRAVSSEKRLAIARGKDATSYAGLLNPPEPMLALPAPSKSVAEQLLCQVKPSSNGSGAEAGNGKGAAT